MTGQETPLWGSSKGILKTPLEMDSNLAAGKILNVALEIIRLLTGEDYMIVRKPSDRLPPSDGPPGTQSPSPVPPPHSQKILELTHKMLSLLTGEQEKQLERRRDLCESATENKRPHHSADLPEDKSLFSSLSGDEHGADYAEPVQSDHAGSNNKQREDDLTDVNTAERTAERVKDEPDDSEGNMTDVSTPEEDTEIEYITVQIKDEPEDSCDGQDVSGPRGSDKTFNNPPQPDTPTDSGSSSPQCPKSFSSHSDSAQHQTVHKRKLFSCSQCGKTYSYKAGLVIHERTHTGEKPFACPQCGRCFARKSVLDSHLRVHTGEKPYSCYECRKCFSKETNLITHLRIHTGERPFGCADCGKRFIQKSDLINHQRIHTGEKPYACPECTKRFTIKSDLITHRRIHTGEKPFGCSDCDKRFVKNSLLIAHQRIHTGEKPFLCSECGKRFTKNSILIAHQKTHTGKKSHTCSECAESFTKKSELLTHRKIHSE